MDAADEAVADEEEEEIASGESFVVVTLVLVVVIILQLQLLIMVDRTTAIWHRCRPPATAFLSGSNTTLMVVELIYSSTGNVVLLCLLLLCFSFSMNKRRTSLCDMMKN